jgi:hypothetical protein
MKILLPRGCFGLLALIFLVAGVMALGKGKEPGVAWFMIICALIGVLRYFYDRGE